jgi:endonuclease/exonuclease/phosphatase family metal-dependent hydrolase
LNLDDVVDVLESTAPDVVTLQEVPRGFLPTGGIDMLGYVQRSLDLPYLAFQPAASGALHGNAVLSRYPIRGVSVRSFPRDGTALPRGAMAATIDVPVGDDVLVIAAHLPPGGSAPVRAARLDAILDLWDGRPRTVVGLDANAVASSRTLRVLAGAGFVIPDDTEATFPSSNPRSRIDFVLHTDDLEVVVSEVLMSQASDHLPVLVVIRPAGLV